MTWSGPLPLPQPRLIRAYQRGSSILPFSSLFKSLVLLLILVLLVFAGIFYAEGDKNIGLALVFTVVALICGLWYIKKKKEA